MVNLLLCDVAIIYWKLLTEVTLLIRWRIRANFAPGLTRKKDLSTAENPDVRWLCRNHRIGFATGNELSKPW
jgi:hypothetical protein